MCAFASNGNSREDLSDAHMDFVCQFYVMKRLLRFREQFKSDSNPIQLNMNFNVMQLSVERRYELLIQNRFMIIRLTSSNKKNVNSIEMSLTCMQFAIWKIYLLIHSHWLVHSVSVSTR